MNLIDIPKSMLKYKVKGGLFFLSILGICVLAACARTEGVNDATSNGKIIDKPSNNLPNNVTVDSHSGLKVEHLIGNGWNSYTVDYVENSAKTYGCFIYDSSDSGDIFCFKLGE